MNEQQILANCQEALRRVYPRFEINFCYCIEELIDYSIVNREVWYKYPKYRTYSRTRTEWIEGYLYLADITIWTADNKSLHAVAIIQQYREQEHQEYWLYETRVYYTKKDLDSCGIPQSMSADGQHTISQTMTNQGFLQYGTTKEDI